MKHKKLVFGVLIAAAIVIPAGKYVEHQYINPWLATVKAGELTEQERKIKEIQASPEFQERAYSEAERIYYRNLIDEAKGRLEELDGRGFSSEAAASAALVSYLEHRGASELVPYADEIIALPRWQEVIAIASHETSLCAAGVGSSRNNCGAIKNSRTGEFKRYATAFDSIEDIAVLLQKPQYAEKSLAQMNGTYCYQETGDGGKCDHWTESVELALTQLKVRLYGA